MIGLLRSENLKIFTTKVWWAMLLGLFGLVSIALFTNSAIAISDLDSDDTPMWSTAAHAANIYTSGQYFGILFAAILGALLMTNEYRHQTLTGTFLATPNRLHVMGAKLLMIVIWGAVYALAATALNVPVGMGVLSAADVDSHLGDGDVVKAVLLNLLAFSVWATIGFGVGSMFRSQAGAIVVLIVGYFATSWLLSLILAILSGVTGNDGLRELYWYLPNGATQVMTSAGEQLNLLSGETDPDAPPWWVGMLMLMGYGGATATIGVMLSLKRDVG